MTPYTTRIGHVHLKVRDLDRAVAFYTTLFHLRVVERVQDAFAFLSGSDTHHEIALQNVGQGAPGPNRYGVGLYHVAFEVADKAAFAQAYDALTRAGVPSALVDHRISWAVYFNDPDGNGLEIYTDTRADHDWDVAWDGLSEHLSPAQVRAHLPVPVAE